MARKETRAGGRSAFPRTPDQGAARARVEVRFDDQAPARELFGEFDANLVQIENGWRADCGARTKVVIESPRRRGARSRGAGVDARAAADRAGTRPA